LLLMFGVSVFAALRLFGAVGSGVAPPTAAPRAEQSGPAAHAGGEPEIGRAPASAESAALGHAQANPRNAHAGAARERHAAGPARSRHATQLSARMSSRSHALRHHAASSAAPAAAWQSSNAASALSGATAEAELAPSSAASATLNPASGSDAPSANASSASTNAELSSNSPAQSEALARDPQRATSLQPSAAEDSASSQTIALRAPTSSDSELVHRALKALRHDHDPALAARLLDQQRAAVRGGPLAEEALALQIEATSSLRQVRSRDFAREYLARYPNGRYRSVAEKVLQDPQL
jgi:hypothetical protein